MARTTGVAGLRLLFAFLGFSAVVTEIATLVARGRFAPGNFFSYFTIESNLLAVVSLVLGALAEVGAGPSAALDRFRGAVTLFMTTTILVFVVLLSGYPSSELTAVPWDNTVLHYVMPLAVIVDWVTGRRAGAVPVRAALLWLLYPLAYLAYSLVRGPLAHWYPYPFMDPSHHGYLGVAVTSVVIAVVLGAVSASVALVTRRRAPAARLRPA